MPRTLRLDFEGGIYHVINRGNYREFVFADDPTKAAFLKCLEEACQRSGWIVHAWCVMSNHYHLAIETPAPTLVLGMQWLQGTFAVRFNRFRDERGHLFQGRYKSLLIEPGKLGSVCHYIHLNPVRAHLCIPAELPHWKWSSMRWLARPSCRAKWYSPHAALEHAGGLADTASGRARYLEYLAWLSEDAAAQKHQRFDRMSRGWVIGTKEFKAQIVRDHVEETAQRNATAAEGDDGIEHLLQQNLDHWLSKLRRHRADISSAGKSESWKLAVAAAMKAHSTASNRWLARNLAMGNLHEVSRKVHAWRRRADLKSLRQIGLTPNPKT